MRGRPMLRSWSGGAGRQSAAGVLVLLAVAAIVQATTMSDVHPVRAQAFFRAVTAPTGAIFRAEQPAEPSTPSGPAEVVPPGRSPVRVPILMYHYIRINPDPRDRLGFNLSVTPSDFKLQMDWLRDNGYHPVDFDDLRAYIFENQSLPARPVLLTFDDGYRDMYTTAFPILHAHRFKGVSYVVSGFLNSPNYITTEMLQEMDALGVQIGAHTVSHADLTKVSAADLHHEVFDSKAELEALVGHPVVDFCYPSGKFSDAVASTVLAAGFQTATTTQQGVAHSAGDRLTWTRVRVSGAESLEQLIADLGQPEPAVMETPANKPAPRGLQRKVTFPLRPPPTAPGEGSAGEGLTP
jgi:peptidoglycan/xylan/chitin deacetylase (PgdA/CDA1 family)